MFENELLFTSDDASYKSERDEAIATGTYDAEGNYQDFFMSIFFLHTGCDRFLPFIEMSHSNQMSLDTT